MLELPQVTSLWLSHTRVTAQGAARLSAMPRLAALRLDRCAICDHDLVYLKHFTILETITFIGTQVTEDGARCLKKALPNIRVFVKGGRGRFELGKPVD